jgi:hypothetical protein
MSGTSGSDIWLLGPNGLSTTVVGGVEPTSTYVPVGGETRVTFPLLDLSSVAAVGIPGNHAPQVVYLKETDGSFLVPPALAAQFSAIASKRI